MPEGLLVLEDGTTLRGNGFGAEGEVFGELVFNTSMSGYQESFTDPSYAGQILLLTYPLIGNYGFHLKLCESDSVRIRGLVIKEPAFFSTRGQRISRYLRESNVVGLWGIDTRALTLKLRYFGTMKAMLIHSARAVDVRRVIARVKRRPHPDTENLAATVSCRSIIRHANGHRRRIVLIDCGVKRSMIASLRRFANVIQVPYDTTAAAIKKFRPAGIVVSNGPGNPEHPQILQTTVRTLRGLIGRYPILGVCMGNHLLALALGAHTYKLKFGHRGANHAVKNLKTGKIYITSQNHSYAVRPAGHLEDIDFNWVNVNDGTIEGLTHRRLPVFSVQFHPEAAPGPNDTAFLFEKFIRLTDAKAH